MTTMTKTMTMKRRLRHGLAEFLGVFAIVFAGTGAIVVDQETRGQIGHAGIALTFGLVVLAMIYTLGDVSGAHMNPAVTLAFAVSGRFSWLEVPGYVVSQVLGGVSGSLLLGWLFPKNATLGATLPLGAPMQSFVLEVVLTFLLMLVILGVSTGAKEKGITAGIVVGAVIGLEAMFAGPICGASMNPVRSLGPAVATGHYQHLWIYLVAPVVGAVLAIYVDRGVRERNPVG